MRTPRIRKLLAAVLLLAAGVGFIVFGGISLKQIKTFPQVDAVVSHVQHEWVPDGDGGETQEITIFVTYTVDGTEYTEELQNTKTNLHQGDEITIYYNPEDPTEVSGATKGMAAIQLAVGGALCLCGLGSLAAVLIKGR